MKNSVLNTMCFLALFLSTFNLLATNSNKDNSEYTIVVKDHSLIFDVVDDEASLESIKTFGLVMPAAYGDVQRNDDLTFEYKPSEGVCDVIDSFSYFYEGEDGRDTVTVYVDILCESLTIMSGFTPEAKEAPMNFTILGIENYPENTLYIFNSDGNEVFYKEGYKNDWNGTKDGYPLPRDFVYFYVFNDGLGNLFSGYVQIN